MSGPAYIDSFRLIKILPDDVTIAADAVDDTLTLVAGPGISLVANAGSDQITIVNTNVSDPGNDIYAKSLTVDKINIDTNVIQINESNADLIVRSNASGSVVLESGSTSYEFDPTGNLRTPNQSLFINPNSGITNRRWVFETYTLGIPSVGDGTLASEIRVPTSDNDNTSSIIFPGPGAPDEWGGIAYIKQPGGILEDLYGNAFNIYMVGADVRITAQDELNVVTAKQWTFKTDGALQFPDGTLQTTAWTGVGNDVTIGSIRINTNLIQTVDSNADLELLASGTGAVSVIGNLLVSGILKGDQFQESFTLLQDATGTVTHDCSNGQVFLHTSPDADWTANFTNLNLDSGKGTTVTLLVEQGATAYIPNAVQVGGIGQTVTWQGSASAPTGNANKTDIVSFTILNNSGTYKVYGQLTSFG